MIPISASAHLLCWVRAALWPSFRRPSLPTLNWAKSRVPREPCFENAPRPATEPRDCPTRNFQEKMPKKIPLGPKFWNPKKKPQKYPQNTKNAHFLVFSRYFGGIFLGFQNFGPRVFFFGIFLWKFRVGQSRGSTAGRGVLKPCSIPIENFNPGLKFSISIQMFSLHRKFRP